MIRPEYGKDGLRTPLTGEAKRAADCRPYVKMAPFRRRELASELVSETEGFSVNRAQKKPSVVRLA